MPRQWYIKSRSGCQGPFSSRVLRRLAGKGKLTPNTGVSRDGETWFKAKNINGLEFAVAPTPKHDATSQAPTHWFIQTKNSILGPFSIGKLNRLAKAGKIQPNVAVSHNQVRWIKAKRVQGIVFDTTSASKRPVATQQEQQPSPRKIVTLPIIDELPFIGALPQLSDLPLRRDDVTAIRLPVIAELPLFGPLPDYKDYAPREPVALPVIQEVPIAGPVPQLSDLPLRRSDVIRINLPVIAEAPIAGPLPTIADLPLRRADVTKVTLPVVQELPIAGKLPSLANIAPTETVALPDISIDLGQLRRAAYIKQFGQIWQIDGSQNTDDPAVDICIHPGSPERPFTTLVTNGMSDVAMEVPEGRCSPRAELILYASDPQPAYINLLRSLARISIDQIRGFYYGSTMSNGEPSRPIFANSKLDSFVFMVPAIRSDFQVSQHAKIDDAVLQLLWVVPITTSEKNFLQSNGMKSFCDLLNRNQHLPMIDPQRPCYIDTSAQSVG